MNTLAANPYFWLAYFALAFAMGYWNYRKGHNLMIGFFISLLLTPVTGLLFNIFAKPNREVLRKRDAASMKPIRCASCGEMIPAKSTKCRKCGARVGTKKSGRI
jgi:ribosomal protein L40E